MAKSPSVSQVHDKFFKMAMADKRASREFFETHLPPDIRCLIDLNQIELEPGSYINDLRQESITDMLFSTEINGHRAYLHLLIEHQSRPDALMPFRILKYSCNIIDKYLKETGSKKIPFVFPLVVYHGKTRWTHSNNINDLVDAPKALVDHYFLKPFQLIDLTQISDETLKAQTWSGVLQFTLKHIFARDIQPYLPEIIDFLREIESQGGQNFAVNVLIYILDRAEIANKEAFLQLVKTELSESIGGDIMTIAEQFRIEGREEGREEERRQIIRQLRATGMDKEAIAKILNLSPNEVLRLMK